MRNGAAMLLVLVAVAIMMVLYFLDLRMIFGPSLDGQSNAPASRPWLEEDLLASSEEVIDLPKAPKPQLTEPRRMTAAVTRQGAERGTMELAFGTDGRVSGTWRCGYRHGDQDYAYDASFAGNIAADRIYVSDGGVRDRSLLYFITKGAYTQRLTDTNTNRTTREEGTIYVTGWLGPDGSARGLVTITTDRKWSVTYDWISTP